MRYVILVHAEPPTEAPPQELMDAIGELGEEATKSGTLLDNAGLAPSAKGARVDLTAGEINVIDGPFTEAKELISYAVYDVRSKEEAVEWARRFLDVHRKHWPGWEGEARVHKTLGPEDFG